QAKDLPARQATWKRIADILERQVGDVDEAIAANLAILDESPDDPGALEILERRLSLLGKREALSRPELAARAEVLRRIAELLGGPLENAADALIRWREILEITPGDPGALAALEKLLGPGVDEALRLAAAEALEPVYESAGRFA